METESDEGLQGPSGHRSGRQFDRARTWTAIMPSTVCACTLSARFAARARRARGCSAEQSFARQRSRERRYHCSRCWRGLRLRFILKDEQPRASRLLRNRPSSVFCVQSAANVGAPPPERRGAQRRWPRQKAAQAAPSGCATARLRQQDRARAAARRVPSRARPALTPAHSEEAHSEEAHSEEAHSDENSAGISAGRCATAPTPCRPDYRGQRTRGRRPRAPRRARSPYRGPSSSPGPHR
jgi:hypothetical protein